MIDRIAHPDHLYRAFVQIQLRYWAGHPKQSRFPPGSDGETLPAFAQHLDENLRLIARQLTSGEYRFAPFIERRVTMSGGREKSLSRATLRDTLAQKAIATVVEPALDPLLPECLHAFRRRRADGPGLGRALSLAAQASGARRFWIVQEDIHAYFDHVRHDLLLETLGPLLSDQPQALALYTAYLQAPRQVGGQILPRQLGLPIGSILSNFLANVYLLPLDEAMAQAGFHYLRYCDDLLVVASSEGEAEQARALMAQVAGARGLELNPDKSGLAWPGAPFVYLGYEFEGDTLRVGRRAIAKFRAKVRRITARGRWPRLKPAHLQTPRGQAVLTRLIRRVNRLITGNTFGAWPRYFSRAEFDEQFRELDVWTCQRIRGALFHRWKESDARYLPNEQLQAAGLRSLVGEYWRWRRAWKARRRSLLAQAAQLERLREALGKVKTRAWDAYRGCYRFRPGLDGVALEDIIANERAFLLGLQTELLDGKYRFGVFSEYALPRQARDDPRWIARPGLADAVVARALASTLASRLNRALPGHIHSYRPGRGSWTAIGQLRRWIVAAEAAWVVRADVAGFLDQVDLVRLGALLDDLLPNEGELGVALRDVLQSYLWAGRWRKEEGVLPREQGLPRGGALTPMLGNLYLLPLDHALAEAGFKVLRYADDIVIVAFSQEEAQTAWGVIQQQSSILGLPLSQAKSGLFAPGETFEFLGYQITDQRFDVRPYAVNRLKRRVRRVTHRGRWARLTLKTIQTPEGRKELARLVRQVNRLLVYGAGQDWARRFARCTDDATFRELDAWIADRIRACVTHSWSPRNHRLVPNELLREMGLVKLVGLYYNVKRQIAGQAAKAALARQVVSSPEAGA